MKFQCDFRMLEDDARSMVMKILAVEDVCPACMQPLSHRVVAAFHSGRRILCSKCGWSGTWRAGTPLANSRLSCTHFLFLQLLIDFCDDDRKIARFLNVHPDTVKTWREHLISAA